MAEVRARRAPCCRCGQPIDYTLFYPDANAFTVDHFPFAWSTHPHSAEDPANLAAAPPLQLARRQRPTPARYRASVRGVVIGRGRGAWSAPTQGANAGLVGDYDGRLDPPSPLPYCRVVRMEVRYVAHRSLPGWVAQVGRAPGP